MIYSVDSVIHVLNNRGLSRSILWLYGILVLSTKNLDLWQDSIFWVCEDYSFRILRQSDLSDLTEVRESQTSGIGQAQVKPRGRDSWCWPKGARPLGTRMAQWKTNYRMWYKNPENINTYRSRISKIYLHHPSVRLSINFATTVSKVAGIEPSLANLQLFTCAPALSCQSQETERKCASFSLLRSLTTLLNLNFLPKLRKNNSDCTLINN